MANGFNVQRYRSLSRPRTTGGSSSSFSSLAKKQASAEDAIVDSQYEAGIISAEYYQSELLKRSARPWTTPLQKVNLDEKIVKVREAIQDAEVDRLYQAGDLETDEVLAYERAKLSRITETDTLAYQKQAQKVQALVDKAEREKRTNYRIQEQLRISGLPEDSSESLAQKAQLYADLEFQARTDGDNQQADQLAIQKNNLTGQARRAELSDRVRDVRRSVSEYIPISRLSSSEGGQSLLNSSSQSASDAAVGSGGSVPTVGSNNVATGGAVSTPKFPGSGGTSSSGVAKAYKSYDAAYNSLLASYQDQEKISFQIGEYKKIYEEARAAGDLDTADSLEIQINNMENSYRTTLDSIANKEARLGELEERIYAAQAAAAKSAFRKWKSEETNALEIAEANLKNDLRSGKLNKFEYIDKALEFTQAKRQFLTDVATESRNFGDDDAADRIAKEDLVEIELSTVGRLLNSVINNPDPKKVGDQLNSFAERFELIRVDKDGTLDNLTGTAKAKGDISLQDVSDLKESGAFKQSYVQDGNVYAKIKFPGELGFDGQPVPVGSIKEKFQLGIDIGETPFYYDAKGNKKKVGLIEVKALDGTKQSLIRTEDWLKKNEKFVVPRQELSKDGTLKGSSVYYDVKQFPKVDGPNPIRTGIAKGVIKTAEVVNKLDQVPGVRKLSDFIFNNPFKGDAGMQRIVDVLTGLQNFDLVEEAYAEGGISQSGGQLYDDLIRKAGLDVKGVQKGLSGLDNFELVGDAYAEETKKDPTFDEAVKIVSQKYGIPEKVLRATAAAETGAGRGTDAKTVKPHNYFNIQAYDSNVNAAREYRNALEGVEAFAKLIKTDKRYQKAYAVRNNPEKFLQELERAGYAGDPRTYAQRAANNFNSWSEFVMATPEFKNGMKVTPTPTPTPKPIQPIIKKPTIQIAKPKPTDMTKVVQGNQPGLVTQKVANPVIPKVVAPIPKILQSVVKDTNQNGRVDFRESVLGQGVQKATQAVKNAFTPQPIYQSPVPSVKPPTQTPVQKAVQNVGNTVQQAAQNVGRGAGIVVDTAKKAVQKATGFLKKIF